MKKEIGNMDKSAFKQPADIYRGTDFWMLNDRLTEEGIRHQLREMKDKGVYSFIARTYIGLKSDYPGADFKAKMHIIVDSARELGLKVFLQAGYMPEAVVGLPPEYALRYIYPVREGQEDGRRVLCRRDGWSFVEHNSMTFLDMFDPQAVDFYLAKSYSEMWEEFSDEYGKTILSVWVDEPSYNGAYLPWTPQLEHLFFRRWGYPLPEKVWMLYFDGEGCETVRYHYRVLLRDLLEENYFRRVRQWCSRNNLLFSGHLMMEDTISSQISRAGAIMPYYKYFDIPGIDVLSGAMNWVDEPIHLKDIDRQSFTLYNTAMQCVSAARQTGQEHILAEMYGVTTENMTFRNQLNMFDSYAAMGINHRSAHGIFYSLRGRGKRAYPPHINYYQPYWDKYKNVTDYCARVSAFISQGRTEGDIAVVHPLETGFMLYRGPIDGKPGGGPESSAYDKQLYYLLSMLKTIHRDPELCDLATLRDLGRAEGGQLQVGKMRYGTVILPNLRVITKDFMSLLEKFTAGGGRLIILGAVPAMLDGFPDEQLPSRICRLSGAVHVNSLSELEDVIAGTKPAYRLDGRGARNLLVNRRVTVDGMNFFLYNNDCSREAAACLSVEGGFKVLRCDPFSGGTAAYPAAYTDGATRIEIKVPCGGSLLLALEAASDASGALNSVRDEWECVREIGGQWQIIPNDPNVLLLEYCRYRKADGEFSQPLPIIAVQNLLSREEYRGRITLQYEFHSSAPLHNLSLALESPSEQSIFLDGREISHIPEGYFFEEAFETLPLGDIATGRHTLELVRQFRPLTKASSSVNSLFETQLGVELEPIYLLGDFKVRGIPQFTRNGCMVYERDFTLDSAHDMVTDGELTGSGFPFFVGKLTLAREFTYSGRKQAAVRIGIMNAAAGELFLNGVRVGDINRAPIELDCTEYLRDGKNRMEIRLYTTLRNIVGPFHRPRGEVGNLFGGGYKNPDAAWLSVDLSVPGWEKHMSESYPDWTDGYNLVPFGIDHIELVTKA